jgi:hypothetical protein
MSLLARLRRSLAGRFPEELRAALEAEGADVLADGLRGTVTFRHYRAPGRRSNWRKVGMRGGVAVTRRRVVVTGAAGEGVDLAREDPRLAQIEVTAEEPDRLLVAYDASVLAARRAGRVEIRLRTPEAARIAALLTSSR